MNEHLAIWRGNPSPERIRLIRRSTVKTLDDHIYWCARPGEPGAKWHKLDRPVNHLEYAAFNAWLDSVCPQQANVRTSSAHH